MATVSYQFKLTDIHIALWNAIAFAFNEKQMDFITFDRDNVSHICDVNTVIHQGAAFLSPTIFAEMGVQAWWEQADAQYDTLIGILIAVGLIQPSAFGLFMPMYPTRSFPTWEEFLAQNKVD